jgi:hypothetical protein
MAVVQRSEEIAVPRIVHHDRDVVAHKRCAADGPFCRALIHRK